MNNTYENMTPIEELASRTLTDSFNTNKKHWKAVHKKQERLYKSVRNISRKKRPNTSSYNRTYGDDKTTKSRSNMQIGTMWMLHNIAYSIVKQSILEADDLMELEARKGAKELLYLKETSDHAEDLFTDDIMNIKDAADKALWDAIATGAGVLVASWRDMTKRMVRSEVDENGEDQKIDEEISFGGYPHFDHFSPWDVFPTAGSTDYLNVHEVIFQSKMTVNELREWERQGLIKNLDAVIRNLKKDGHLKDVDDAQGKDNLRSGADEKGKDDASDQIEILTSYCYFPLYKYAEYQDNDGQDRSKDEIECIMIKAKNADQMLLLDRNPFAGQAKPWILAGFYFIPGEFWPITVFEIVEKLVQGYEDMFNLIQDGANASIYPMKIIPNDGIDEAEVSGDVGVTIHMDPEAIKEGAIPQYVQRPNSILPEMYNQRDFVNQLIQEVTAIVDFIKGMVSNDKKTATEVLEMSQNVRTRFKQAAIRIEKSLMKPIWEWIMVMMSESSDDQQIMDEMGTEINPYKQFYPVMPNPQYKIKLTGALRSAESQANKASLASMIEMAKEMPPMPIEDDGELKVPNVTKMFFDLMKMSGLPDVDKYELIVPKPDEEITNESGEGNMDLLTGQD